ncbi:hypothetical protein RV06_GL001380 [Enterococcus haemoperoxidus]|nr:hypothetical protein RV06_GL001380 [Enterococcus haemoperoxidus]
MIRTYRGKSREGFSIKGGNTINRPLLLQKKYWAFFVFF